MPAELLATSMHITGTVTCQYMTAPEEAAAKESFAADADVDPTKMMQRWRKTYSQKSWVFVKEESGVVHVVIGATGTLKSFHAGAVVANLGNAIVEVDRLKNGVWILLSKIELNSTHEAREVIAGDIDTISPVADDVLEVSIDGTVGTGTLAKGVFAHVVLDEQPA